VTPHLPKHLATLDKFHKWTKSLFGKAEPCFSCKHHVRVDGSVEINRGGMRLLCNNDGTFSLYDHSQGAVIAICVFECTLERALMEGLKWAIQRKFYDTYPS
jgi:hypothetical protein